MQVTKTLKKDVLNSYNTWLYSYLNGDIVTYNSYFDDTYHFIGSTDNEEYLNKKETTNFFKATSDQLAGKCDLRNETKIIEKYNELIFITHLFDGWFINGEDLSYYGRFRFSSIMQNKENEWKFIHQHFSTTDSKTSNGETIGFDKVNLENQELRIAIKRRTIELEAKNRELEIEGALEKVRSRTMAMQHSDELQEASFLLDQQVRALSINTWGCAFNIYGESDSTEWFGNEKGILHTYKVPRAGIFKEYYENGKKGESLLIKEFSGDDCVAHYEYMSSLPFIGDVLKNLKKTNNGFPTYQIDHVVYFKYGYLLFITREPVPDAHAVFKRFAKVFEQTYARFLDLQKAEVQAREAQIEMALEKVRSRTMAMQNSSELPEAANNLFLQVQELGIPAWSAGYCIWEDDKKSATAYMSSEGIIQKPFVLPTVGVGYNFSKPLKKGDVFHVGEIGGNLIKKHYDFMRTLPVFGEVIDGILEAGHPLPTFQIFHICYFKYGYVMFITYKTDPKAHDIFKRFAKVFEQTYTRFLDLQKVEAQAKEAQIESALERVRSSAMAMHKSDDLTKAVDIVFSELKQLEFNTVRCGIGIFNDQSKNVNVWTTSSNNKKETSHLSGDEKLEGHPLLDGIYKAWEKQVDFSYILKNKDLESYYHVVKSSNLPVAPPSNDKQFTTQYYHLVVFPAGGLFAFSDTEFTQDKKLLMKRFGEVFHLSFIRHLDLKQAEIQSRESQIQLSLERVRAKAMSMHNSNGIDDVLTILCAQFDDIGILP
ncbi:MAG: nuclear transport factor 2 family protein, partial [Bizionia sp.]|nr:nuclear transport factor 2 family protein [Bizionia sp.]